MPRGDRRTEIMRAAETLFTSRRVHEVTLDDVAKAAKVGKGTIYRYFADKDDLIRQTVDSGFEEMCELLQRLPEGRPFQERLLEVCQTIAKFFESRHQLMEMMHSEEMRLMHLHVANRERRLQQRNKLIAAIAGILAQGQRDGCLRPDLPPELLAHFLMGLLHARGRDLADRPADWRRPEVLVDVFCHGAGCPKS